MNGDMFWYNTVPVALNIIIIIAKIAVVYFVIRFVIKKIRIK